VDRFWTPQASLNSELERVLRERLAQRGAAPPATLPAGEASWTQLLFAWERVWAAQGPQVITAGGYHTAIFNSHGLPPSRPA